MLKTYFNPIALITEILGAGGNMQLQHADVSPQGPVQGICDWNHAKALKSKYHDAPKSVPQQ